MNITTNRLEAYNEGEIKYISDTYSTELKAAKNKTDMCFWINQIIHSSYEPADHTVAKFKEIIKEITDAMEAKYDIIREEAAAGRARAAAAGSDYLEMELPADELNEDEGIMTCGDSIAYQFYSGNFTDAINEMKEHYVRANDLLDYLEMQADEFGFECVTDQGFYNGHFSCTTWVAIGSEVY